VTSAELLSVAALTGGRYAQAFPGFGSERKGALVVSFCRIADAPIRTREPVTEPDVLIIQDPTLLHQRCTRRAAACPAAIAAPLSWNPNHPDRCQPAVVVGRGAPVGH